MAKILDLGKVMASPAGKWREDASYEYLSIVEHKGSGYISRVDTIGVEPGTNEDVWMLLARAGETPKLTLDSDGRLFLNGELLTDSIAEANALIQRIQTNNAAIEAAEQMRKTAEADRVTEERNREEQEMYRKNAENTRRSSETARVNAEVSRREAEDARVYAESRRVSVEAQREERERNRMNGEISRGSAETQRVLDHQRMMQDAAAAIANINTHAGPWVEEANKGLHRNLDRKQTAFGDFSVATGVSASGSEIPAGGTTYSYSGALFQNNDNFGFYIFLDPSDVDLLLRLSSAGTKYAFFNGSGPYVVSDAGQMWGTRLGISFRYVNGPNQQVETPNSGEITVFDDPIGAFGYASCVDGIGTQAFNEGERACGKYNKSILGRTVFTVGIGTAAERKNAIEVWKNGTVFVLNVGGYDGTNSLSSQGVAGFLEDLYNTVHAGDEEPPAPITPDEPVIITG